MLQEIFGKKLGMTQVFDASGDLIAVTLVDVEPVRILEKKEYAKRAVAKIGCFKWEEKKLNKVSKPNQGYFKKMNADAYHLVREVPLQTTIKPQAQTEGATVETKDVGVEIFQEGEVVDVRAKTKGRGFSGGMKRHGWHGGPMTHGSMSHRRTGSNGSNTDPGRVVKGHRMPGHYGNAWRTVKNVKVVKIDKEKNLLFIRGAVPGYKGTVVNVKKI